MKNLNKMGIISLILTPLLVVMTSAPTVIMAAAQPTVNLGTISTFAVFASSTITNTGTTIINGSVGGDVDGNVGGNVGLYPGTVFTGQASATVSGTVHLTDAIAQKAKEDLLIAYDDAAGRTPTTTIATELGGTTLKPGTYVSADGTFEINGKLTLDAEGDPNGVFVFKTAATLVTGSTSSVNLVNSARFCRTFWQVGSSATLGTNSDFKGHIFASESITATTGAKIQGQLLALNGAVTLDNNTITNGYCEATTPPTPPAPAPAILHVIKHVVNDNGGKAVASSFNLHVKTAGSDVSAPGVELPGTKYTLAAGTYTVSEDTFKGYTASYSGDSDSNGKITLAPGEEKTVTITNDDIASSTIVPPTVPVETPTPPVEVVVTPATATVIEAKKVTTTVTGGQLPKTSSYLYEFLLAGVVLTLIGSVGWISRKRSE